MEMEQQIDVAYETRQGKRITATHSIAAAQDRLQWLLMDEQRTRRAAPTDCGDTRFNYTAEARALNAALFSALERDPDGAFNHNLLA
jgi:hypothetical protein